MGRIGTCRNCKEKTEINKKRLCKVCSDKRVMNRYFKNHPDSTHKDKLEKRLKKKIKKVNPKKDEESLLNDDEFMKDF